MNTKENITKAQHSAEFLYNYLHQAMGESALIDMVLLDAIKKAVELKQLIDQLQGAIND
ncbi:MAG: hypothetical protein MI867_30120 [Pseudomonadales bacterium]|nr:hypothetical protein [Pseudomonadales bacterium]